MSEQIRSEFETIESLVNQLTLDKRDRITAIIGILVSSSKEQEEDAKEKFLEIADADGVGADYTLFVVLSNYRKKGAQ